MRGSSHSNHFPCHPSVVQLSSLIYVLLTLSPLVSTVAMSSRSGARGGTAVFGVGVLGTSLCRQLLHGDLDAVVTGITKSSTRHDEIRRQVVESADDDRRLELLTGDEAHGSGRKFENVVFCAPPSGFEDYSAAVKEAAECLWAGPDAGGVFVFTSSGAV